MEELKSSLGQYENQLTMVAEALAAANNEERDSLLTLQSDLQQLIQLTQESLDAHNKNQQISSREENFVDGNSKDDSKDIDDEYALFMQEMAQSGAYDDKNKPECSKSSTNVGGSDDSDIEDELATLPGMKCAVYHTFKWGGQSSLHNAMVSAVVPKQDHDQFNDLQVRVLYTHPTHSEMLPCPFYLDGECRFSDEQCRYSHGTVVQLSNLKEAIEPDFNAIKAGSKILVKLKPPDNEDISLTRKSTEKYHLWHKAIVTSVDLDKRSCMAKLEAGAKTGEKRKSVAEEMYVSFEELFPLDDDNESDSDSEDSLSDTEYPDSKALRPNPEDEKQALLIEKCLLNNAPAMGEWERHTRGIGSKLMLAMGYVPGTGLGAAADGRVKPVEARLLPVGKSLDHCMAISEKALTQDPLKVEQKLKRLQKKEEERNKRMYEREKERERRNVFIILNKALGDKTEEPESSASLDIKQSTSKDLNIEQFKIMEDTKRIEREIIKLQSSLTRHAAGSGGYRGINVQIAEKKKELNLLRNKEQHIAKEQRNRKDKQKMTVF